MKLSNLSVKYKLLSLIVLAFLLLAATSLYNLQQQRSASLHERELKLSAQVDAVSSLLQFYRSQADVLGEENAKKAAIEAVKAIRYDGNNYFWILQPDLDIVLHPLKAELIGKNARNFQDGAGKYHWQEMGDIARTKGSGFLDYVYKSPQGEIQDKISYVKLAVEDWEWVVGSGILIADINADFYDQALKVGLASVVLSAILAVLGTLIARDIVTPLETLKDKVRLIAHGDLRVRINFTRKDELGRMGHEIDDMLDKLQSTLNVAHSSAERSSTLANSIAQASEAAASNVRNQYSQLDLLSTAMTEMSSTIADVAGNAENTSHSTSLVTEHSESSANSMDQTAEQIAKVSEDIAAATKLVIELESGVNDISKVVDVIRDVSEQTNLLALNAAIEAARAGEQGRGFAVVADEVRNLASRTQQSTDEVQRTIDNLIQQTKQTVAAMQRSNERVEQGVSAAMSTKEQLLNMVNELQRANDMVAQIAAASEQQGIVANEMNENASSIHYAANEVNQSSDLLAKESQSLAAASQQLDEQLKYFKV